MRALAAAGFHPIRVEDAARYIRTGDTALLPRKPILITFDDGRTEAMLQADPILRDTDMRAAVFAIGKEASSSSLFYIGWGGLGSYAARRALGAREPHLRAEPVDRRREGAAARVGARARQAGRNAGAVFGPRRRRSRSRPGPDLLPQRRPGGRLLVPVRRLGPACADARRRRRHCRRCSRPASSSRFDQDRQAGWRFALPGDNRLHIHRLQVQDWTATQFIARLAAAAKLSQTAFRERGLDVHYDRRELVSAAVSAACAPVVGDADHERLDVDEGDCPELRRRPFAVHPAGARRASPLPRARHVLRARREPDRPLAACSGGCSSRATRSRTARGRVHTRARSARTRSRVSCGAPTPRSSPRCRSGRASPARRTART